MNEKEKTIEKNIYAISETAIEMTKDRNRIVVYNKKDKKAVPEGISISAINGDVESLVKAIEEKYAHELTVVREDTLNNERQIGLAMSAEQSMKDAITSLEEGMELDLVTIDLEKAWNALCEDAVHPDGFLGYVQGTGNEPKDGHPVTYDSQPDFEDFGVGCFLLAGSEMAKLAER